MLNAFTMLTYADLEIKTFYSAVSSIMPNVVDQTPLFCDKSFSTER